VGGDFIFQNGRSKEIDDILLDQPYILPDPIKVRVEDHFHSPRSDVLQLRIEMLLGSLMRPIL
jgi:hypothetical protein